MTNGSVTQGNKPIFLAFTSESDTATLKIFCETHHWPVENVHNGDIHTAIGYLKNNPSPNLLLVEIPSAQEAPDLIDALADVCEAGTKVIITGHVNEYSFYCWLTEIGIFSYLLKPLSLQMLENTYQKSLENALPAGKTEKLPAKVIAVTGARGGVGSTTLALNIAGLIAENSTLNVALVDIDSQDGSIALALDIEPSRGVRDALERPERIDDLFVGRAMHKIGKRLSVLSAEESLQDRITHHENAALALMTELRSKFDIVVLDAPRQHNDFTHQCVSEAEYVVLVTELSLISLRDVLRVTDMLRETLGIKTPPLVVANKTGLAAKNEVPLEDFEKAITRKLSARIPFAPDIYMISGHEIPAVKNKQHVAVKALMSLVEQMVPETKKQDATKKSFFSNLLKKPKKG